jgi:hypothetical protein
MKAMNLQRVGRREKSAIGTVCPLITPRSPSHFLMLLKEFLEQSELLHQLERGGMNSIAAKIAIEIRMLFQDGHLHTRARQKEPEHHARRPAARHHATCAKRFCVTHSEPITWRATGGK